MTTEPSVDNTPLPRRGLRLRRKILLFSLTFGLIASLLGTIPFFITKVYLPNKQLQDLCARRPDRHQSPAGDREETSSGPCFLIEKASCGLSEKCKLSAHFPLGRLFGRQSKDPVVRKVPASYQTPFMILHPPRARSAGSFFFAQGRLW
jgi:hypothetical protein